MMIMMMMVVVIIMTVMKMMTIMILCYVKLPLALEQPRLHCTSYVQARCETQQWSQS